MFFCGLFWVFSWDIHTVKLKQFMVLCYVSSPLSFTFFFFFFLTFFLYSRACLGSVFFLDLNLSDNPGKHTVQDKDYKMSTKQAKDVK